MTIGIDKAQLEERVQKLESAIMDNNTSIAVGTMLTILLVIVIIYLLYRMFSSIRRWIMKNRKNVNAKNKSLSMGSSILLDDKYDDEPKKEVPVGNNDEYSQITQTIRNNFLAYQTYNASLQNFYMNALKKETPDKIDASSLLAENDNW